MKAPKPLSSEGLARIEQMIEEYRARKEHELLQRAMKLWRRAASRQALTELDKPPERLH